MIYLGKIAQFVDNGSDREFGALHRAQIRLDQMPPSSNHSKVSVPLMTITLWNLERGCKICPSLCTTSCVPLPPSNTSAFESFGAARSQCDEDACTRRLHFLLSQHPDSGFITFSTNRWPQRGKQPKSRPLKVEPTGT